MVEERRELTAREKRRAESCTFSPPELRTPGHYSGFLGTLLFAVLLRLWLPVLLRVWLELAFRW